MKSRHLGLNGITTFSVPSDVLEDTISFLSHVGQSGCEGFVVWGGSFAGESEFRFTRILVPEQRAYRTSAGLLVTVEGSALFEINRDLHESGELLGGQVHTHPTTAYHSPTDDHYPLVTLVGALSIVIPNFARDAMAIRDEWCWYRLTDYGQWSLLADTAEVLFE